MKTDFHLPVRPYSPIDAYNRRAAAQGSPTYGQKAAHADYNGHCVEVSWNEHRRYYTAEYRWAGRRVLARGEFAVCLAEAQRYYNRGALGSTVRVSLRDGDEDAAALCTYVGLTKGPDPLDWITWKHEFAARLAPDHTRSTAAVFDWDVLKDAESKSEYLEKVRAKHGRV